MLSLVTLPETAVASTTEYIGTFVTDLWGVMALAIGIPLAFYVIGVIINLQNENDREYRKVRRGTDKLMRDIDELEDFYNR